MSMKKIWIKQYPHGFNDGFEYRDGKCPPLTTSSWQHNNFVVIAEEENEREDMRSEPR